MIKIVLDKSYNIKEAIGSTFYKRDTITKQPLLCKYSVKV